MKTYICQICGDAYLGEERPRNCPFCGAREHFIKIGKEVLPIVNQKIEISELSGRNLEESLGLELRANLIYLCMAGAAHNYELKAMYKRLAEDGRNFHFLNRWRISAVKWRGRLNGKIKAIWNTAGWLLNEPWNFWI